MELIDKKIIHDGYVTIVNQITRKDNGDIINLETVETLPGVAALVRDIDTGKYIFVKQYRVCNCEYMIEIPGGSVDNDDIEKSLEKEILEEIGYSILYREKICEYYSSPGTCTEKIHLYFVEGQKVLNSGGGNKSENEEIEIIEMEEGEIYNQVFEDSKTIIAVEYLKKK